MHTKGTDVKGRQDRRVAQGDATRASLVKAARELFGEDDLGQENADQNADVVAYAADDDG